MIFDIDKKNNSFQFMNILQLKNDIIFGKSKVKYIFDEFDLK